MNEIYALCDDLLREYADVRCGAEALYFDSGRKNKDGGGGGGANGLHFLHFFSFA